MPLPPPTDLIPVPPPPALDARLPGVAREAMLGLLAEQPLAMGVAQVLRGHGEVLDEAEELDWAVRHWEAARRAGQRWSADFGECWRQIEFAATALLLEQLAALDPLSDAALPRMALVVRAATRYRELKPLLPWLETQRPGVTQRGFG